jgi:hypothetical protein
MKMSKKNSGFLPKAMVLAIAAAFSGHALATDFEVGDGWQGSWTSSVSMGSSWRATNADNRLYGQGNGALLGRTDGSGANTIDEGNLNYKKGDRFTTLAKLFTEVELKKGDMGALVRAKAWYDYTLNKQDVSFGNQANGYNGYSLATNSLGAPRPLSDAGFDKLLRFDGVYLLDAYVYDTFDVAGKPLQIRVGNQVVNWGEGLFIQGVNQINPIDVPSFRKPGAQLKEVFLPVPILFASQSLGDAGSVEAFYQWKFKPTPIEAGCGNYWAVSGSNISTNPGACNNAVTLTGSNPLGYNAGAYIPIVQGMEARNSGEFGVAYRVSSKPLDTEFGLYAMKIHARIPAVSVNFGNFSALHTMSPISAQWDNPEDMKIFGISAATNLSGWSVASELSHTRDFPAQIDGNDLLLAGLGAGRLIVPGVSIPFGPLGNAAVAAAAGNGKLTGYTRATKTQLQFNAVKAGNGILGAGQYLLVAETGFQWNNLPDYKSDPTALRYGRGFIFGGGSNPAYGGSTCGTLNISPDGCKNDGYATRFAWGYRVKGELTYNNLIEGVTTQPSVFFSHDVKGYSIDSQFLEKRMALGLGVRFTYNKKYSLELAAVRYNSKATYDPLSDRSFYSINGGISF